MEIHLTPEQESFVRHAIDAGRFDTPEQAVSEALNSLAERERLSKDTSSKPDAGQAICSGLAGSG